MCGIELLLKRRDLIIGLVVGLGGGLILIGLGVGCYCWRKRRANLKAKVAEMKKDNTPEP
jgi:uncharacterized iron-regulated membrane protein